MAYSVDVDGAKVAFRVDGSGPGLLLLHGTGGNAETNWSQLVDDLSASHMVVRPDYSGSGETIDDGRPLTVPRLAAQVVAAGRKAGATPFDLVGFSLGAAIAIHIAAEYAPLVRSVVLLSGFVSSTDSRQRLQFELWRDLIQNDRGAMARLLLLTGFSPDFLAGMDYSVMGRAIEEITKTNHWSGMARQVELDLALDVRDEARRITRPSLVIGCTHDAMVPPAHARQLAELIPDARFLEMATGHLAVLECPHQLAAYVLDFIAGNPVGTLSIQGGNDA